MVTQLLLLDTASALTVAGTYSITVTDGWGCSATSATVVVNGPTEVKADLVLSPFLKRV
jgi:hypothetical protein